MSNSRRHSALRLRPWVRIAIGCSLAVATIVLLLVQAGTQRAVSAANELPDAPQVPESVHLIVPATLDDYYLPGTQPNMLTEPLAGCSGCHVEHISTSFAGSMMSNSARDPLFRAALQIANNDVQYVGEFCIRCHVPNAWLNGRSEPTNGSTFVAADMQWVSCNACHRMVAPFAIDNEAARNANERTFIKNSQQTSLIIGSGAYIVDRLDVRRGPFVLNTAQHATQNDSFMRSSLMCATCHEIDNPLYSYDATLEEFVLNDLGQPAPVGSKLFPVERTYSEWESSAFNAPGGVTDLSDVYPGLKRLTNTADGPISVCQDCHMPMENSKLVDGGVIRKVGRHEWAGGSSLWQVAIEDFWDDVAGDTFFDSVSEAATLDARTLGREMLERAADLEITVEDRLLTITVTNNTGHKLPTGYAEGRRMWLEVVMFQDSQVISRLGELDADGYIVAPLKVYEIKQGLTENHANAIGRPELTGESFHFALNNIVLKDNRIPPRGWTNVQYESRSMEPVGAVYADGQYTDTTTYLLPIGVDEVDVKLMYQTASGEYLDFLEAKATDLTPDNVVGSSVIWGEVVGTMRDQYDLDRGEEMAFTGTSVPGLAIEKTIYPSVDLLPGQPITMVIPFTNTGIFPIGDVEITDALPSTIVNATVQTVLTGGTVLNQNGNAPNLAWSVNGMLAPEIANTIYIMASVNPQVSADMVLQNTVETGASVGTNGIERSATAVANVVVPRVQLTPSKYVVKEDDGSVAVTVMLDKVNPYATTTYYVSTQDVTALAGDDYVALNNVALTIPAGAVSAKFMVQLVNDGVAENTESFKVLLTSAMGASVGTPKIAVIEVANEDMGTPVPNDVLFMPSAEK